MIGIECFLTLPVNFKAANLSQSLHSHHIYIYSETGVSRTAIENEIHKEKVLLL